MQISDTHGTKHQLLLGDSLWLDSHLVGRTIRTHNTLIVKGFLIPHEVRRKSVGSVILHTLERHAQRHGVVQVKIVLHHSPDHAYHAFFAKHGYTYRNDAFEKLLLY